MKVLYMVDLSEYADHPFVRKTMEFVFPIFVSYRGTKQQRGSCTLITIDNRFFIVTAAHVAHLRHESEGKAIYIYIYKTSKFIRLAGSVVEHKFSESIRNSLDLAIIEIELQNIEGLERDSFVTIDRLMLPQYPKVEHKYLASGYPSSRNTSFPRNRDTIRSITIIAEEVIVKRDAFEDQLTIILDIDIPNRPSPVGMSGGALWLMSKSLDLPANPMLAGILVSFNKKTSYLTAVKIDVFIASMQTFFPGSFLDRIALPLLKFSEDDMAASSFPPHET